MKYFTVSWTVGAVLAMIVASCGYDTPTPPILPPPVLRPQDGLWTASGSGAAILRLSPPQLQASGNAEPATRLTTGSARLFSVIGLAFDTSGDLWISSQDDTLLLRFPPEAIASSGSRTAATIIAPIGGSISGPAGLAFDSERRLWVANSGNGTVVGFDRAQLVAGGAQTPAVVLSGQGHPVALAFDAAGTLWVSDNVANTIVGFASDQLRDSGVPRRRQILTEASGLVNPAGLAIDGAGNLWVANSGADNLVAFSPGDLTGAAIPAPRLVVSSNAGSLNIPVGLAFDANGSLWVVGGGGTLTSFPRASLAATGAPPPITSLTLTGHFLFWNVAFWPKPDRLPLPVAP